MKQNALVLTVLLGTLAMGCTWAADQERSQDKTQTKDRDQTYGNQLMTPQERSEYQSKMRAAKTAGEREKARKEHHEFMKERAKERGVTLPDQPPRRGNGMGSGSGVKR